MALIRSRATPNNQGGRGGCLLMSPHTANVFYVTIEYGRIVVRDYDGNERAQDGPTALAGPHVSACFASPGQVAVTVVGFHANTSDSAIETYLFDLPE